MKALRQPPQRRSIVALVEAAHFPPRARPAEPRADPFPDGAFVRLRCPASSCPPRSFNSNAPPRRNRRRCRLQISDGDVVIGTAIRYLRVNDAAGPDGLQHSDDAAPLVNFCRRSFERNAQCHCRPARMVVVQAACGEGSTASATMANPCRSAWAIQPESSSDSIVTTCAINSAGCFSLTRIVRRVRGR